jgi:chemotaxis protein methyltransferase CheR
MSDDELSSFINFVYEQSGYDFRRYSPLSLQRRVSAFQAKYRLKTLAELREAISGQAQLMRAFIENMTVQVTEMFRDPFFYLALKEHVVDILKTYPRVKIWHAGCSNGAEVYSMAIFLKENGLLDRTRIYATDINENALKQAHDGVYDLDDMQLYTKNYQQAGGKGEFSSYYRADNVSVLMNQDLKKNVIFAFHNLATDWVFTEAHLVVCRNVLIYFDRELQDRTLELFMESLARRGVLALGAKESLRFSSVAKKFETLDHVHKIYRASA